MTAIEAIQKIQSGKAEFVVDQYGYGLRRLVMTSPSTWIFINDKLTERTRRALEKKGFAPKEMFPVYAKN